MHQKHPQSPRLWYYVDLTAEQPVQLGPVPEKYLRERVLSEHLPEETPIWCDGLENWITYQEAFPVQEAAAKVCPPSIAKEGEKVMVASPPPLPDDKENTVGTGLWVAIVVVGFVLIIAIGGEIGREAGQHASSQIARSGSDQNISEVLRDLASEMNKGLPQAVDSYTRLNRITVQSGNVLRYDYTLITVTSATINQSEFRRSSDIVRRTTLADSETRWLLENGVTFQYHYSGYDGRFIGTVTVRPSDLR